MNKVLVKVSKKELENLGYAGFWKYNGYLERFPDFIILAGEIIEENRKVGWCCDISEHTQCEFKECVCDCHRCKDRGHYFVRNECVRCGVKCEMVEEHRDSILHPKSTPSLPEEIYRDDVNIIDTINELIRYLRAQEKNQ